MVKTSYNNVESKQGSTRTSFVMFGRFDHVQLFEILYISDCLPGGFRSEPADTCGLYLSNVPWYRDGDPTGWSCLPIANLFANVVEVFPRQLSMCLSSSTRPEKLLRMFMLPDFLSVTQIATQPE